MAYIKRLNQYNDLILKLPGIGPIIIRVLNSNQSSATLMISNAPNDSIEEVPNEFHRENNYDSPTM